MTANILVAGIGNIFLGDDGFGPEVVRRAASSRPDQRAMSARPDVRIVDYGIRGMHLAYDLLDPWDTLVLVDAVPSAGSPGRLRVFEADHEALSDVMGFDAHSMDPTAVFASLRALGGTPPRTVVVGCEAGSVEEGIGLSEPVAAAVDEAVTTLDALLADLVGEG